MHIAVLAGGRSPEHDISLSSAHQVLRHLDRSRFTVWPVFLDRTGGWWPARAPLPASRAWSPGDAEAARGPLRPGAALDWLLGEAAVEVVFPVLHGPFGEDGTVQGMLELHDVPFVGSGCAASAVAMDKLRTRQALAPAGVPMPRAYTPDVPLSRCDVDLEFARLQSVTGLPAFCKTDCSGSSRGVSPVHDRASFLAFVETNRHDFQRWFGESRAAGEEITVAVLGNRGGPLQALPPVGIYPRFCDHFDERAKYEQGACVEVAPPRGWDAARCAPVQALAERCHELLGCDGMSRTDMIVTRDGPLVLEVNTIPGLTATSLLPRAAAAAGLPMPRLLDRLVDLALGRPGRAGGTGAAGERVAAPGPAAGWDQA